ncbi:hypothetical protein [Agrococcus sp. DT81.2]|uniref:hypothetical protein n=1 Tax=Agrococcus sp. DT81.2 TaxID=3393414 RepID=UPI003CE55ED7
MSSHAHLQQKSTKRLDKKLVTFGLAALILAAVVGVALWYFLVKAPHDSAVAAFDAELVAYDDASAALTERTGDLDESIASLQAVIDSDEQPLELELLVSAGAAIGTAQGAREEAPAAPTRPTSTSEIEVAAAEMPALVTTIEGLGSYDDEIAALEASRDTLQRSIEQRKQVTNPSEAFVIERIQSLPGVAGVQAVTEDNDPNGNLNKQGGYTATVYLSSALVDQSAVIGTDIVEKGTEGGGAVEVYETVDEATARDEYLALFDGGILRSGSHVVLGTVVIRTSDNLTATQQRELESAIHDALIRID